MYPFQMILRIFTLLVLTGFLIYVAIATSYHISQPFDYRSDTQTFLDVPAAFTRTVEEGDLLFRPDMLQLEIDRFVEFFKLRRLILVDKEFRIIAGSDRKAIGKTVLPTKEIRLAFSRKNSTMRQRRDENGVEYRESVFPIHRRGVPFAVAIAEKELLPSERQIDTTFSGQSFMFVSFLLILVIVITGFYIFRFFSSLGKISGTAKRLAAGDFKQRIHFDKDSEFGLLAESVNQIAEEMESRIRDAETASRLLAESNRMKERNMRILSQMAGGVAHEVRNPLAGIRGFAELLAQEIPKEDKKRRWVEKILQEVTTLEALVRNVLDFARPRQPEIERINLENLLLDSIESQKQAAPPSIKFSLEKPTAIFDSHVDGDLQQLKQVFSNVLRNAVEAIGDKEGQITVSLSRMSPSQAIARYGLTPLTEVDYVVVSIKDTGPGMTKETLDSLFTPFFTTKASGTGLGLSIMQKIVESHGGSIRVESSPGEGACFILFFPTKYPFAGLYENNSGWQGEERRKKSRTGEIS